MESPIASFDQIVIPRILETSTSDIIRDFFIPLLRCATRYDRGVGYFSSGWMRIAAQGMVDFAARGGRARWVTSPILDTQDWEAMLTGDTARDDDLLKTKLRQNVIDLANSLENDTLSALAWMIADEIITFKLARPRNKLAGGEFHDKFGVFVDEEGNRLCFNGSYNDSIQGTRNYESIKVFCSWEPAFVHLVDADADRFEKLWSNLDPNVRVFELPEAVREQIIQLRKYDRPYAEPNWLNQKNIVLEKDVFHMTRPAVPVELTLRDYQLEAIDAWFKHNCHGFLEMATGTGKTMTALSAATRLFNQDSHLAAIIAVPYQHLVDQWDEESKRFGFRAILAYQNKAQWLIELKQRIMEFNEGYRNFFSVITTHSTFIDKDFQACVSSMKDPVLLIADEAHHLGAERSRQVLPTNIRFRMALSATPNRWFDEEGTTALQEYFGDTVFSFPLDKAIGVCLTPYYYYPHLVELTAEEMERYEIISAKIARLAGQEDDDAQEALKILLIKRAELLNRATNKIQVLSELIDSVKQIDHTLFYCAPDQIDEVVHLLGAEKGVLVHRFTAEENPQERKQLLNDFGDGILQALAAMRCLDEGVDVPSTRTAFILASSSNPREFIQRRGRILRRSPGKMEAVIHDLMAVPPSSWTLSTDSPLFQVERKIVRRELNRFKEFANSARNKYQAIDGIWEIARRYNLRDFSEEEKC